MNTINNYCVLGAAGLMGGAAVYDLLKYDNNAHVIAADCDQGRLDALARLHNTSRLSTRIVNANNLGQVESLFTDVDSAIAAVHYGFNLDFTETAIKTGTHLCDLGGNSEIVDKQLSLSSEAERAGVSIIPDCGLAPGMVSMLVKWGVENFDWADTVKIRVGGLPQNPMNELNYERLFSIEGLINEYIEPVRVLRNGEIITIDPLVELEDIEFPEFGTLEAFTTSGGTSTLINTYEKRLKNLDYKTIRYPGHCKTIREKYYEPGLFHGKHRKTTAKTLEETIPICTEDVTLVKIIFEGKGQKHELVIVDKAQHPFTSMKRMTAFPASIVSQMQANDLISPGVNTQENCVNTKSFITELGKRNIVIQGI